jgi:hypothetical protein
MPGCDEPETEELLAEELLLRPLSPEDLGAESRQIHHEIGQTVTLPRACLIAVPMGILILLQCKACRGPSV